MLAYLVPVLGWFAILPITTVVGTGATTLALLGRNRLEPTSDREFTGMNGMTRDTEEIAEDPVYPTLSGSSS